MTSTTIALGWWIAPAVLTVAFLAGTRMLAPRAAMAGPSVCVTQFKILCYAMAAILSLPAWLAWAAL